jgi:hypothetical protein
MTAICAVAATAAQIIEEGEKVVSRSCNLWNRMRRYGWITADEPIESVPNKELFCYVSSLPDGLGELWPGARVQF